MASYLLYMLVAVATAYHSVSDVQRTLPMWTMSKPQESVPPMSKKGARAANAQVQSDTQDTPDIAPFTAAIYILPSTGGISIGGVGTLVAPGWILTSADTATGISNSASPEVYVQVGPSAIRGDRSTSFGQSAVVSNVYTSPDRKLALLQLRGYLDTMPFIVDDAVRIANAADVATPGSWIMTGVGEYVQSDANETVSEMWGSKRSMSVDLVTSQHAQQAFRDFWRARGLAGAVPTVQPGELYSVHSPGCASDRGAPLYRVGTDREAILYGVFIGPYEGCGDALAVATYVDLTGHEEWIRSTIHTGSGLFSIVWGVLAQGPYQPQAGFIFVPTGVERGYQNATAHISMDLSGTTGNELWLTFGEHYRLRKVKATGFTGVPPPTNVQIEGRTIQLRWRALPAIPIDTGVVCDTMEQASWCPTNANTMDLGTPADAIACRQLCAAQTVEGCCDFDSSNSQCMYTPSHMHHPARWLPTSTRDCGAAGCSAVADDMKCPDGPFHSEAFGTMSDCYAHCAAESSGVQGALCCEWTHGTYGVNNPANIAADGVCRTVRGGSASANSPGTRMATACHPRSHSPGRVEFDLRGIDLPNNCNDVTYEAATHLCPDIDLLGAGVHFVRQCPQVSMQNTFTHTTDAFTAVKQCDLCNACQPSALTGYWECEENGVRFTRAEPKTDCFCKDGVTTAGCGPSLTYGTLRVVNTDTNTVQTW